MIEMSILLSMSLHIYQVLVGNSINIDGFDIKIMGRLLNIKETELRRTFCT